MKSKMAVALFFAFLTTDRHEVPNMVKFDDDPRLMTQPAGVLVPLPHGVPEAMKEIAVLTVLREAEYDAVLCIVTFSRAEEVLRLDYISIGWFSYS